MITYYSEIENNPSIKIYEPFSKKIIDIDLPNCYFINDMGILYNGIGDEGHKEARLLYTLDSIQDYFEQKVYKTLYGDTTISLKNILIEEQNILKRIKETGIITDRDTKSYLNMKVFDLNDEVVINLIKGIITSKISLLSKFISLSDEENSKSKFDYIMNECNGDLSDILVRYCKFHKISSVLDKTIISSSINLNDFINYLENDWSLMIVPTIRKDYDDLYLHLVYDSFIEKHPEYEKKIKIMSIKDYLQKQEAK